MATLRERLYGPYLQFAFNSCKRGRPIITKFRLSNMKILVDVKRGPRII